MARSVERGSGVAVFGIDWSTHGACRSQVSRASPFVSEKEVMLDKPVSLIYTIE